jgi:hypothetical protein
MWRSSKQEGLDWRWQGVVFVLAALAVFSRRPDLFLHVQFYAEDGRTWFAQAYNQGWLHSLTIPDAGYLNTLQRLLTGPALLVPFRWAPLVQMCEGLVLQVLPVTLLLSSRCRTWGSLPARCLMAAVYIAVPSSSEIHVVLTDSQWHLALIEVLLAFGEPPRSTVGRVGDVLLFLLCGFCGPFGLMLIPLTLVAWFVRRREPAQRWHLVQAGCMAVGSAVQVWELTHGIAARAGELGASPVLLMRMLGGEIFACGLLGTRDFAHQWPLAGLVLATLLLLAIYTCCLVRGPLPLRLLIVFSGIVLLGALRAPMIAGAASQWVLLTRVTGSRYWAFPILAMLWCLVWMAFQSAFDPTRLSRRGAQALLALLLVGVAHDWRMAPLTDEHFAESAARFEAAPPGAVVDLPEYPDGWVMRLVKRP